MKILKQKNLAVACLIFMLSFLIINIANAEDYPCDNDLGDQSESDACSKICPVGDPVVEALVAGIPTGLHYCKSGYRAGAIIEDERCYKQQDCAAGLYCKSVEAAKSVCGKKISDGEICNKVKNGIGYEENCKNGCSSGNYKEMAVTALEMQAGISSKYICSSNAAIATNESSDIPSSENVFQGTRYFVNPLKVNNLEDFLSIVLSAVQKVVVTLALVFIVIGAFFILTSAGAPDMVERGKKIIAAAIIGLAIGIAAPSILKELAGVLGWGTTTNATVNAALTISQIAVKVLNFLLGIAGIMSLIMLVIGGIIYLTSAGDEDRIANGKKIFTYSLLGIIIIFSAMVLVKQIALFFVANPSAQSTTTSVSKNVSDEFDSSGL